MFKIKKMTKVYRNKGVTIENNGDFYNFPLNSLIVCIDNNSNIINFKLKTYKRTILSIPYKDFVTPSASTVDELLNALIRIC